MCLNLAQLMNLSSLYQWLSVYLFLQLFVTSNLSVTVLNVFHIFDRNIKKQVKNQTLQNLSDFTVSIH